MTELEKIEKMAQATVYKDPEIIESITRQLLDMKYCDIVHDSKTHNYLARDISKGFMIEIEKLKDCTVGEMLAFIGFTPAAPWWEPLDDDILLFESDNKSESRFSTAGSCFVFGRLLNECRNRNLIVGQFMHIEYKALMCMLAERYIKASGSSEDVIMNQGQKLNAIYYQTVKYVKEKNQGLEDSDISIGDVIETLCKNGLVPWICTVESIARYGTKIRHAYRLMNDFFMESIRMNMISTDRVQFREMLDRCSLTGRYNLIYYAELKFDNCYEKLPSKGA